MGGADRHAAQRRDEQGRDCSRFDAPQVARYQRCNHAVSWVKILICLNMLKETLALLRAICAALLSRTTLERLYGVCGA
jgi:hypothetical protein